MVSKNTICLWYDGATRLARSLREAGPRGALGLRRAPSRHPPDAGPAPGPEPARARWAFAGRPGTGRGGGRGGDPAPAGSPSGRVVRAQHEGRSRARRPGHGTRPPSSVRRRSRPGAQRDSPARHAGRAVSRERRTSCMRIAPARPPVATASGVASRDGGRAGAEALPAWRRAPRRPRRARSARRRSRFRKTAALDLPPAPGEDALRRLARRADGFAPTRLRRPTKKAFACPLPPSSPPATSCSPGAPTSRSPHANSAGRCWSISTGRSTTSTPWRAATPHSPALWIVDEDGSEQKRSFRQLSERSAQVANWLRAQGVRRGDRILLMLGNELRAVGVDARRVQARRGRDPRHGAADARTTCATGSTAAACATSSPAARTAPSSPRSRATTRASPSAPRRRAGWTSPPRTRRPPSFAPDGADAGRRPAAAVLHVGHDGQAQAGAAHAPQLPGRPPVDDVLDRPAARRRAPQHLLARLGQARVELLLRAVERRGVRVRLQLRALRRARRCWRRSSAAA